MEERFWSHIVDKEGKDRDVLEREMEKGETITIGKARYGTSHEYSY